MGIPSVRHIPRPQTLHNLHHACAQYPGSVHNVKRGWASDKTLKRSTGGRSKAMRTGLQTGQIPTSKSLCNTICNTKMKKARKYRLLKERETGFEPATPTLARLYSTPEPLAHTALSTIHRSHSQKLSYYRMPHLSIKIFRFVQKIPCSRLRTSESR